MDDGPLIVDMSAYGSPQNVRAPAPTSMRPRPPAAQTSTYASGGLRTTPTPAVNHRSRQSPQSYHSPSPKQPSGTTILLNAPPFPDPPMSQHQPRQQSPVDEHNVKWVSPSMQNLPQSTHDEWPDEVTLRSRFHELLQEQTANVGRISELERSLNLQLVENSKISHQAQEDSKMFVKVLADLEGQLEEAKGKSSTNMSESEGQRAEIERLTKSLQDTRSREAEIAQELNTTREKLKEARSEKAIADQSVRHLEEEVRTNSYERERSETEVERLSEQLKKVNLARNDAISKDQMRELLLDFENRLAEAEADNHTLGENLDTVEKKLTETQADNEFHKNEVRYLERALEKTREELWSLKEEKSKMMPSPKIELMEKKLEEESLAVQKEKEAMAKYVRFLEFQLGQATNENTELNARLKASSDRLRQMGERVPHAGFSSVTSHNPTHNQQRQNQQQQQQQPVITASTPPPAPVGVFKPSPYTKSHDSSAMFLSSSDVAGPSALSFPPPPTSNIPSNRSFSSTNQNAPDTQNLRDLANRLGGTPTNTVQFNHSLDTSALAQPIEPPLQSPALHGPLGVGVSPSKNNRGQLPKPAMPASTNVNNGAQPQATSIRGRVLNSIFPSPNPHYPKHLTPPPPKAAPGHTSNGLLTGSGASSPSGGGTPSAVLREHQRREAARELAL